MTSNRLSNFAAGLAVAATLGVCSNMTREHGTAVGAGIGAAAGGVAGNQIKRRWARPRENGTRGCRFPSWAQAPHSGATSTFSAAYSFSRL